MSKLTCANCQSSKVSLNCGLCHCELCKSCAEFTTEDQFSFYPDIPEKLKSQVFCPNCYAANVQPELLKYEELMEKSKNVEVFYKKQGKETRLLKRLENEIKVNDCEDKDELILRLAFQAAQLGFNGIIDVLVVPRKVLDGRRQTTLYSATAIPSKVHPERLVRDRSIWQNPN